MQEKFIELDMIRKDGTKYDEQSFNTLILDALKKTKCADFLTDVKKFTYSVDQTAKKV